MARGLLEKTRARIQGADLEHKFLASCSHKFCERKVLSRSSHALFPQAVAPTVQVTNPEAFRHSLYGGGIPLHYLNAYVTSFDCPLELNMLGVSADGYLRQILRLD